jgi:hypothetical protein
MSRKTYLISFIVLAFFCVPVVFHYVLVWMVAPLWSQWVYPLMMGPLNEVVLVFVAVLSAYTAAYLSVYYMFAALTFRLSDAFSERFRNPVRTAILAGVFSLSLLRVNHGAGLVEESEWANMWQMVEACWNLPPRLAEPEP